jgi:RNA-splicing ligase RtcB
VGSLGSGNHFLEVQAVDTIYDPSVAKRLGLLSGQICVMIHCGSRGLGHQISAFFDSIGAHEIALLYDVSHNSPRSRFMTSMARHASSVHRKGAIRALPPGHIDLPADLSEVGQPVLVPGSMGTASYVLAGAPPGGAFLSACH